MASTTKRGPDRMQDLLRQVSECMAEMQEIDPSTRIEILGSEPILLNGIKGASPDCVLISSTGQVIRSYQEPLMKASSFFEGLFAPDNTMTERITKTVNLTSDLYDAEYLADTIYWMETGREPNLTAQSTYAHLRHADILLCEGIRDRCLWRIRSSLPIYHSYHDHPSFRPPLVPFNIIHDMKELVSIAVWTDMVAKYLADETEVTDEITALLDSLIGSIQTKYFISRYDYGSMLRSVRKVDVMDKVFQAIWEQIDHYIPASAPPMSPIRGSSYLDSPAYSPTSPAYSPSSPVYMQSPNPY